PLLGDMLRRPSFAPAELERLRHDRLTALAQQRDVPQVVADDLLGLLLYGPQHRYGTALLGSEASLKAITRNDVDAWHASHLGHERATAVVVGDLPADLAVSKRERALGGWSAAGKRRKSTTRPAAGISRRQVVLVDRPGAAQTEVRVGQPGVER